jgi:hypothetical protein
VKHVYWVAYVAPGNATAAGEVFTPGPITRGEQVLALQADIARAVGMSHVVITTWTLLRVEDTDGQVP